MVRFLRKSKIGFLNPKEFEKDFAFVRNLDKSAARSRLVRRYLTVLDLKMSCPALSASVWWTKTICRGSRVPQPMRELS